MNTTHFFGTWQRITGNETTNVVKVTPDLELTLGLNIGQPVVQQLTVDQSHGALTTTDDDGAMTYWFPRDQAEPLLMSVRVGAGDEPWLVWGAKRTALIVTSQGDVFIPSVKVDDFLHGFWNVQVTSGNVGGRDGDYVKVCADEGEGRYALKYSESPQGPWKKYDEMTFLPEMGALKSIDGHRSISFLKTGAPSRRAIYAMYYEVPPKALMPFEVVLGDDDGTGAWGAEGG